MGEFRFDEDRHLGVFTCEHVLAGAPVLFVSHDDDGDWQFLCGAEHDLEEAKLMCLEDMVALDPSLNELAHIPPCHVAEREHLGAPWEHFDETDETIRECIAENDWFVALFTDEGEGDGSEFAYSIGMFETFEHPEIIVTGKSIEVMGTMINAVGERVREGERFKPGDEIEGVFEGGSCVVKRMHISHYRDYLGYGLEYYGGPEFPVLQLLWPSAGSSPEPQPDLTIPKR